MWISILLIIISFICFVIATKKWNIEIRKLQDANKNLQDRVGEFIRERFIYLKKNNDLLEFTMNLIKQYVPEEDQIILYDKINKDFPVEKELEKVEEQTHMRKFELSTVFSLRYTDIDALIATAKNLGLTNVKINSYNAGINKKGCILTCNGPKTVFLKLYDLIDEIED